MYVAAQYYATWIKVSTKRILLGLAYKCTKSKTEENQIVRGAHYKSGSSLETTSNTTRTASLS